MPEERLGYRQIGDIKKHTFFEFTCYDWKEIKAQVRIPPFKPLTPAICLDKRLQAPIPDCKPFDFVPNLDYNFNHEIDQRRITYERTKLINEEKACVELEKSNLKAGKEELDAKIKEMTALKLEMEETMKPCSTSMKNQDKQEETINFEYHNDDIVIHDELNKSDPVKTIRKSKVPINIETETTNIQDVIFQRYNVNTQAFLVEDLTPYSETFYVHCFKCNQRINIRVYLNPNGCVIRNMTNFHRHVYRAQCRKRRRQQSMLSSDASVNAASNEISNENDEALPDTQSPGRRPKDIENLIDEETPKISDIRKSSRRAEKQLQKERLESDMIYIKQAISEGRDDDNLEVSFNF